MERLWDVLLDALIDCAKLTPFLLVTVFLMEYLEHRAADKLVGAVRRAGRFGPLLGPRPLHPTVRLFRRVRAAVQRRLRLRRHAGGRVPRHVGRGAAHPAGPSGCARHGAAAACGQGGAGRGGRLCGGRALAARPAAGRRSNWRRGEHRCECQQGAPLGRILLEAVRRTLSILLFLFIFSAMLGLLIEGRRARAARLLPAAPARSSRCWPALFGFIPNCAASVLLTQLYLDG